MRQGGNSARVGHISVHNFAQAYVHGHCRCHVNILIVFEVFKSIWWKIPRGHNKHSLYQFEAFQTANHDLVGEVLEKFDVESAERTWVGTARNKVGLDVRTSSEVVPAGNTTSGYSRM